MTNSESYTSSRSRRALVRKWLRDTALPKPISRKDVEECLGDVETLNLREKDSIRWMIELNEIKRWLKDPPIEASNPMTATSAFFPKTILTNTDFLVLTYFGDLRVADGGGETGRGSVLMMKSLVSQLVLHVAERRPDISLDFLKKRFNQKSLTSSPKLISLFCRILDRLSEDGQGNVVFIVIDSVSNFHGSMKDAAEDVLSLLDAVEQTDVTSKVLLTDLGPLFMARLQERQIEELFIPDNVDGGRNDVNLEELDMDTSLSIECFRSSQRRDSVPDDESEVSLRDDGYIIGS
ncbi:hypothetical protein GGR52DRAFT_323697 [Hypoxylon sp. FL1284]|nr:hypothetical protein GGR52DRAFT_323697 [Hypoxylon sp. FL1284]